MQEGCGVFGTFFIAGVQVYWLESVTAEGLDRDATLGAASLSVWIHLAKQDDVIRCGLLMFFIKRQNDS